MIKAELDCYLATNIRKLIPFDMQLSEIRLRLNKPIIFKQRETEFTIANSKITHDISFGYRVTQNDLNQTLELITEHSGYAFSEQIRNGFITIKGGHRIGLTGHVVHEHNQIKTIKHISALNFRIAHEILNCSDKIISYISNPLVNTLIISAPGFGKTTLLRDIIRNLSTMHTVGVVDERSELAACHFGEMQNDLGDRTDVLDNCPKVLGMKMLLRTMSPEVIAVDEIGSRDDVLAIENIIHCGVKIICTAHCDSIELLQNTPELINIISKKLFQRYIFLSDVKHVEVYNEDFRQITKCFLK